MSSLDTRVPALLLRLDRNPFHHGSLGAIRSLGRAGIEVHAFVEPAGGPIARSRHLAAGHHFRGDPTSLTDVAEALRLASARIGRPAVLIPMDEASALAAAGLANRLAGSFLLPAPPPGVVRRVADKEQLAGLCAELGVPQPPLVAPEGPAEAAAAVRALGLPAVAKWSRPWLLPPGGPLRSTTLVNSEEEARRLYEQGAGAGGRLLFQRLLPGGPGADWFFHGTFGAGGRLLFGGTGRKELSWPPRAGLTAVGRWVPNAEVEETARLLAGRLGYHGVLDLDFRRDAATGEYHLLDFNPRPGAQFRLFTDLAGLDVVRALHLDLTGRPVGPPRPAPGRVLLVENYALLASLAARRARRPGGGRGREAEWAWLAADDPAPFFAMAAGLLGRAANRGLGLPGIPPGRTGGRRPVAPGRRVAGGR